MRSLLERAKIKLGSRGRSETRESSERLEVRGGRLEARGSSERLDEIHRFNPSTPVHKRYLFRYMNY